MLIVDASAVPFSRHNSVRCFLLTCCHIETWDVYRIAQLLSVEYDRRARLFMNKHDSICSLKNEPTKLLNPVCRLQNN